jgi:hypothetical protein
MHVYYAALGGFFVFPYCFSIGFLFCWWHRSAYDQLGGYQGYTSMYILRCNEHSHEIYVAQCHTIMIKSSPCSVVMCVGVMELNHVEV